VFFIASKIFWMLAAPINLLLFGALAGVALCYGRHARFGRGLALTAILLLLAAATLPLRAVFLAPLENRFPSPSADMPPPYGIIVLGGAIDDPVSAARGQTVFDEGGERITEAVILAKRFPQARVVYTSGTNSVVGGSSSEAFRARELMAQMGVAPDRVTIEDKARNTEENARFTSAIVHPEPSQRWVIVTSAFHMPRAMGVFEKAGFHPVAYPVSFYTIGTGLDDLLPAFFNPDRNLRTFDLALHEWIGLAAYWATGRIDHLFPGPANAT
jgi:uncharacterized SAM-binding protein YcdF (DUF218 family)